MANTVQDLEKRIAALEAEVASLRMPLRQMAAEARSAETNTRPSQSPDQGQAELSAGWLEAMRRLGVEGDAVAPQRLRSMMLTTGLKPDSNELSREIITMRGE